MQKETRIAIFARDPKKDTDITAGYFYPQSRTFVKVAAREHFMNIYKGYGIQDEALAQLQDLECKKIAIQTDRNILTSHIDLWLGSHAIHPKKDFGHGKQTFLPIKLMDAELLPNFKE